MRNYMNRWRRLDANRGRRYNRQKLVRCHRCWDEVGGLRPEPGFVVVCGECMDNEAEP